MDLLDVRNFLRKSSASWPKENGLNPLQKFGEKIKKIDGGSGRTLYLNIQAKVIPIFVGYGLHPKVPDGTEREKIKDTLTQVIAGRYPEHTLAFVEFLHTHYPQHLNEILTEYGYEEEHSSEFKPFKGFICWTGAYGLAVAEKIKDHFDKLPKPLNIFLSSRNIANNQIWRTALKDGLATSSKGLVIFTQDFPDSPYATFEYATLDAKADDVTVLLLDAPMAVITMPLKERQFDEFSPELLSEWIGTFFPASDAEKDRKIGAEDDENRKESEARLPDLLKAIAEVQDHFRQRSVTSDNGKWGKCYGRPLLMSDQNSSPFELAELLRTAQTRLVLVAQNHYFMTVDPRGGHEKFWPMVKAALIRGVDIQIVCMKQHVKPPNKKDITVPDTFEVWGIYMRAEEQFIEHGEKCWNVFEYWSELYADLKKAHGTSLGKLGIYGAYFTPVTISLVDPDDLERGYLVLSPRINNEAAGPRPQFIIRNKHEEKAYYYYRESVENNFGVGGWKLLYGDERSTVNRERVP